MVSSNGDGSGRSGRGCNGGGGGTREDPGCLLVEFSLLSSSVSISVNQRPRLA